jgi:hypothetical protein
MDRASMESQPWRMGSRAAQARAVVQGGAIVALELTDEGAGYREKDRVLVAIAPPKGAPKVQAAAQGGFAPRVGATAKAILEFEVGWVPLKSRGGGYVSSARALCLTETRRGERAGVAEFRGSGLLLWAVQICSVDTRLVCQVRRLSGPGPALLRSERLFCAGFGRDARGEALVARHVSRAVRRRARRLRLGSAR